MPKRKDSVRASRTTNCRACYAASPRHTRPSWSSPSSALFVSSPFLGGISGCLAFFFAAARRAFLFSSHSSCSLSFIWLLYIPHISLHLTHRNSLVEFLCRSKIYKKRLKHWILYETSLQRYQ